MHGDEPVNDSSKRPLLMLVLPELISHTQTGISRPLVSQGTQVPVLSIMPVASTSILFRLDCGGRPLEIEVVHPSEVEDITCVKGEPARLGLISALPVAESELPERLVSSDLHWLAHPLYPTPPAMNTPSNEQQREHEPPVAASETHQSDSASTVASLDHRIHVAIEEISRLERAIEAAYETIDQVRHNPLPPAERWNMPMLPPLKHLAYEGIDTYARPLAFPYLNEWQIGFHPDALKLWVVDAWVDLGVSESHPAPDSDLLIRLAREGLDAFSGQPAVYSDLRDTLTDQIDQLRALVYTPAGSSLEDKLTPMSAASESLREAGKQKLSRWDGQFFPSQDAIAGFCESLSLDIQQCHLPATGTL